MTRYNFTLVLSLFFITVSYIRNFAYSYCPPLVAPTETVVTCRPPNDFEFSVCSSSWLPNGTVAHYECENGTTGEQINGYILCTNPDEKPLRNVSLKNSADFPCGLKRDLSVPEIHIFGFSPTTNFTTPHSNYYESDSNNNIEDGAADPESELSKAADYERLALKLHNVFRIRHGSPLLKLKRELCSKAQKWADHLTQHKIFDMSKSNLYGQNAFNSQSNDKIQAVSDAIQNWYFEGLKAYNWSKIEANWDNSLALNFAQVIWRSTEYLGIGVCTRNDNTGSVVVAYYYPTGNVVSEDTTPDHLFVENVKPLIT